MIPEMDHGTNPYLVGVFYTAYREGWSLFAMRVPISGGAVGKSVARKWSACYPEAAVWGFTPTRDA
jgi:hypothetical protein